MFGSEILDIITGLVFVYLLLSLVCSAINEYIASMTNKRGKVLVQGIEALLKDSGVTDAFYAHPLVETLFGKKEVLDRYIAREKHVLERWRPGFRWIYRLYSWFRDKELRHYRIPSYLPARTFALALVDASGFNRAGVRDAGAASAAARGAGTQMAATPVPPNPSTSNTPAADAADAAPAAAAPAGPTPTFRKVLETLQRDSGLEVAEFPALEMAARLADENLPASVRERLAGLLGQGGVELNKLHDSVEVWFNNGMDRISGAYKRHAQTMLFIIGLILAVAVNADTLDLWRRLSTNDKLREGLAANAASTFQLIANARNDSTAATGAGVMAGGLRTIPFDSADQKHAKVLYDTTLAALNRTQLQLGWSDDEAVALGVLVKRPPVARDRGFLSWRREGKAVQQIEWRPWFWYRTTFWPKLIGLLVTAFALSLGAPFWFDMLNKVVNVRNAGRAPQERSKSPEAAGKRTAETPTK